METWRTEALVKLVADSTARVDERDDAAMELSASDHAASAGESLGEIAARTGALTAEEVGLLRSDAAAEYRAAYSRLVRSAD